MTRISPTSFGRFSKTGRIAFRLALEFSILACPAALRTANEATYGEMVGDGDFEMIEAVEYATPEYFCDCRSIVYLLRSKMLA